MMRLYVIRHGETEWNAEGKMQGWADIPLNDRGRELARITGEALREVPFDLILSSPLQRARETAALVTGPSAAYYGREIPVIEDERIKEINWGSWEGHSNKRESAEGLFDQFYEDPLHYEGAPDGDSVRDVCARTADFLQDVIHNPEYEGKTILVSTHGCAMRALLNPLYENRMDFWQGHVPYNCAINIVEAENGQARLVARDQIYYDKDRCFDNYKPSKEQ